MNTTYQFWTCLVRFPFIQEALGEDKAKIIETDRDGSIKIELTIENSLDVLYLFHAGIDYGSKAMTGEASI